MVVWLFVRLFAFACLFDCSFVYLSAGLFVCVLFDLLVCLCLSVCFCL